MRTRIVPYAPFGAKLTPLPDALESQIVTPMGELSTASVHYHRDGVGAVSLDGLTELGFEYYNGTAWVEPPNCRFLSMRGSFDHLEATPTRKYSFIGLGWMLRQAKVWSASGLPVDVDGKVQFLSANPGKIMATLITNAKARGWGAGIATDFSTTKDSSGAAWSKIVTIAYDLDLDLEAVLANLYQQGICDFRWEGRTLRIFNPDTTMGRDLTTGASPVRLVVSDGQTSAPEEWTNEDLLTDAMVLGDEGKRWEFTNGAVSPLGRLESVITQGGVSDQGTASLLAQPGLTAGSQTRFSYTREFVLTDDAVVAPFRDYGLGDWVLGQRGTTFERLRTASLSLTVNADGVKGHAVLGDRLEDLLTKLAKRTKGITGGASAGGSGGRPAPEGPDTRVPSAPSGLVVSSDAYLDDAGNARGVVALNWAHDGKASNGSVMDIDRHAVHYRVNAAGAEWKLLSESVATELTYSPLPLFKADGVTPEQFAFRARTFSKNGSGSGWSAQTIVTMEDDTTAPPVPQFLAADVTTWLRTVTVRWQGRGLVGSTVTEMPRDFDHINVYQASNSGMTGAVLVGSMVGAASLWQSGTMPLAQVWYALTAVDRSDNESAMSSTFSVTPKANVDLSAITDKIDGALLNQNSVAFANLAEPVQGMIASASGANANIYEGTIPTLRSDGSPLKVGDNWFDTTHGFRLSKWNGTTWDLAIFQQAAIGQLDIGTGTFGELDGMRLKAGSIYADSIVSGLSQNMVTDPGLSNVELNAARLSKAYGWGAVWSIAGGTLKLDASGITMPGHPNMSLSANDDLYAWPAYPSMRIVGQISARVTSGVGSVVMVVRYRNRDGSTGAVTMGAYETLNGSWVDYSWTYTLPQSVMGFSLVYQVNRYDTNGVIEMRAPFVASTVGTTVIEDGAITTSKLTVTEEMWAAIINVKKLTGDQIDVNALTSDTGWIGSLRAGVLKANSIDSTMLAGDAITAKHTLTGPLLQTVASALRGIKISNTLGFKQYDPQGNVEVSIGQGIENVLTGNIRTAAPGKMGVRLESSSNLNYPAIFMTRNNYSTYGNEAAIYLGADGGDGVYDNMSIRAPGSGAGWWGGISLLASSVTIASLSSTASIKTGAGQTLNIFTGRNSNLFSPKISIGQFQGADSDGIVDVASSDLRFSNAWYRTTTSPANVYVERGSGSNGRVYLTGSASRFKVDQQVMAAPMSLLDVELMDWIDKADYDRMQELENAPRPFTEGEDEEHRRVTQGRRVPGVVAEHVRDAGLDQFVTYNSDGEVQGVMYDRLGVALIPIVRELRDRLIAQNNRITSLEALYETGNHASSNPETRDETSQRGTAADNRGSGTGSSTSKGSRAARTRR